ncbi:MAG: NAD-dependent deacylase [Hyphomicrobiaceae bacterium]|nr:NAD-dependent deacylase [Hyphomicrobiaceae bacterium]
MTSAEPGDAKPWARYKTIVVLTGAGLSAESGIATFRDRGGVWAKYDVEDVATPQGFMRNPLLVHEFYNMRRRDVLNVQPNAAHTALAKLARRHPSVTIVTQNVDPLHERAGTPPANLIHMHGELLSALCARCNGRLPWTRNIALETECPACNRPGGMRPDVVWFGEMPYHMDRIYEVMAKVDLFVSIGTSGNVYPAAGLVAVASELGAHTVELNLEPSEGASLFAETHHGPATQIVPPFVDRILAGL